MKVIKQITIPRTVFDKMTIIELNEMLMLNDFLMDREYSLLESRKYIYLYQVR